VPSPSKVPRQTVPAGPPHDLGIESRQLAPKPLLAGHEDRMARHRAGLAQTKPTAPGGESVATVLRSARGSRYSDEFAGGSGPRSGRGGLRSVQHPVASLAGADEGAKSGEGTTGLMVLKVVMVAQ
jgi:hypothetical protein